MVSKFINYIGVEPDSRSRENLKRIHKFNDYKILNSFAWHKEEKVNFRLCRKEQVSSAFEPNKSFINRFPQAKRFDVIEKVNINAEPLMNDANLASLDFVKLDIQGAEKNALEGLGTHLKKVLGCEIEVEFQEIYLGQPLISEINDFLIQRNFEFIDLTYMCRWIRDEERGFKTGGQLIFGDGLWLKSPKFIINQDTETISKYISICSLYGRFDIVSFILKNTNLKNNNEYIKAIKSLARRYKNISNFNKVLNKLMPIFTSLPEVKNHLII